MADTSVSKTDELTLIRVRLPSSALNTLDYGGCQVQNKRYTKTADYHRPNSNVRQVTLLVAVALLLIGVTDFLTTVPFRSPQLKRIEGSEVIEEVPEEIDSPDQGVGIIAQSEFLRQQHLQKCEGETKQRILNRSLYLIIAGAVLFTISLFLP
jgi:hypothetical protein